MTQDATIVSLLEFMVWLKVLHTPISRATKSEVLDDVARTLEQHIAVGRPDGFVGKEPTLYKIPPIIEVTIGSHIPITRKLRAELVAKFRQALEPVIKVEVDRSVLDHDFSE
jgi:hypothetical protein